MRFVCRELSVPPKSAIDSLYRRLEAMSSDASDVIESAALPLTLSHLRVGQRYGMYREEIIRVEVRRRGVPAWFDPKKHRGQHGIIEGELRVYIELTIDADARRGPSTFESHIVPLVEPNPEQTTLF